MFQANFVKKSLNNHSNYLFNIKKSLYRGLGYSVLAISTTLLAACASNGVVNQQSLGTDSKHARIVIYRPSALMGVMSSLQASIDSNGIGSLSSHSNVSRMVSPGMHLIAIQAGKIGIAKTFYARPGQVYYFKTTITQSTYPHDVFTGLVGAALAETIGIGFRERGHWGVTLDQVSSQTALAEMR